MDRRQFLAALAAGAAGGLAGCGFVSSAGERANRTPAQRQPTAGGASGQAPAGTQASTRTPPPTQTPRPELGRHGRPSDICAKEAQADPGIYAVTEPAFASDWQGREVRDYYLLGDGQGLADDQTVLALSGGGVPRAYPLSVLWHHEIVNDGRSGTDSSDDANGGTDTDSAGLAPVVVTYCPICRSGMVADRVVDGEVTTFRVSGLLWNPPGLRARAARDQGRVFGAKRTGGETVRARDSGNLVMVDEATGSFWSQFLARAICGPETGAPLSIRPSTVTTWGEWRRAHPDGEVLLPPPHSGTTRPERAGGRTRHESHDSAVGRYSQ